MYENTGGADLTPASAPLVVASGVPRHLRVAAVLAAAGMISVLLLLPYLLEMLPGMAAQVRVPLPAFALLQMLQGGLVFLLLGWVGLRLGYRFGLDAPYLRRWLRAGDASPALPAWRTAVTAGLATGGICILIDASLLAFAPQARLSVPVPAWWKGLLASFYGGISEEVVCRLFLVSLLVWIGARIARTAAPGTAIFVTAIALAALLFAVGHLPALAQAGAFTPPGIVRTIALNTLCGITFGWLFWRHGLEHAMVAHFSADLVLHVAAPLLL
jgi:hypothetical protein